MFQESMLARIRNGVIKRIKKPLYYSVFKTTGVRIQSEAHYHDLSMIGAVFNISTPAVKEMFPSKKLIPIERASGITDIHLIALEYRSIDLVSPYNEFAICIPALYKIDGKIGELRGYYYLYLPVTTEEARWVGVDIYGFPKFIAEISFEDTDQSRSCTLKADDKEIITLKVNKLPTELKSWEYHNFGIRDKKLVRNIFQVFGQGGTSTADGGATYTLGDHHIAVKLRTLEIGQVSIQHDYVYQAQAVLSKTIGSAMGL